MPMLRAIKPDLWRALSVALIAIVAAWNEVQLVRSMPPTPRIPATPTADVVGPHERRLAALRAALEARSVRGVVGYVTDLPPRQIAGDAQAVVQYYLSQFALVPLVLDVNADEYEWAVANLHGPPAGAPLPAGFRVVEDFGSGVLLLRKAGP